jgi:iron(III) transport system permease protein
MIWSLFLNSILVSGLSTLCSLLLGFVGALGLATLPRVWRNTLLALAILALVLPPFLVTNAWLDLFGQTGRWRDWLPLDIYSLGGTVWVLTLLHWPITLLLLLSAWRQLEPSHLEQDTFLAGAALIKWLLWPLAGRALGLAAVLTLVLTLNHFAVPALLQVKVLPALLWVQFNTTFDYSEALRVGWPLWIGPVALLVVWKYRAIPWPSLHSSVPSRLFRRQLGPGWAWFCLVLLGIALLLSVGLPLTQLVLNTRTWSELEPVMRTACLPAWNSFRLAFLTAAVSMILALLSWRWRWGHLFWLPFLIPGVWLGVGLIQVLNWPVVRLFYPSMTMVVAAWTIRFLAPAWLAIRHAFQCADADLRDAARLSGASSWGMLRLVYWPQVGSSAMAAGYIIYLLCLWDVETLILIVPPGGETLALRIFNLLHYGHNAQVNALCLVLLGLALAPLGLWSAGRWLRRTLWMHA